MNEPSQEAFLQRNTKLLRKSVLMPQQTKFEALKRTLEAFVRNGVTLFNKWCQHYEPVPTQESLPSPQQEVQKSGLKYSFQHFTDTSPLQIEEPVEKIEKSALQSNKMMQSFSEDPQNSKIVNEEQSFEARFKKGHKRTKMDESESSFDRQSKRSKTTLTKQESRFYEAANFGVFLQMQKHLLEAKKKCKDKNEEQSNSKCTEYLKYALKVGSLTTQSETNTESNLHESRYSQTRKQGKNFRKKILFEDESHQLYDLSKVYESLDAEKLRRQEHRRMLAEKKRKEEEQRALMIQRMEQQKRIEALQREQAARLQKEQQERERKQAEEKLLLEQQQKEAEIQQKSKPPSEHVEPAQPQQKKQQNIPIEEAPKIINNQKSQELPQTLPLPIKKVVSQQKKQQVLVGTPVKQAKPEQSQTPLKVNPFLNPPAKAPNLQQLINTHKPTGSQNSFFSTIGLGLAASPPRANNIFNNATPVNNLFTGGVNTPSLTPTTLPNPIMKQPQPPPMGFGTFPNPTLNSNSPNPAFTPVLPSFMQATTSPGFNPLQGQTLGFNSSGSSSGGLPAMSSVFPPMQTQQQFNKNLFMDQPAQQQSIFGGFSSNNPKTTKDNRGKKQQIRIS